VLDAILRLLHPYIPYITEELWQRLRTGIAAASWPESVMIAEFPGVDGSWIALGIEKDMDLIMALVREVRNIRASYGIKANRPLRLMVTAKSGVALRVPRGHEDLLVQLAGLEALEIREGRSKPANSAAAVVGNIELFVPLEGLIDIEAERARLEAKLGKIESQLVGIRRKLGNPGFVNKAPAEVVDRQRQLRADLEAHAAKLRANIADLR
jgi:valyl-tRNA synthetase